MFFGAQVINKSINLGQIKGFTTLEGNFTSLGTGKAVNVCKATKQSVLQDMQ